MKIKYSLHLITFALIAFLLQSCSTLKISESKYSDICSTVYVFQNGIEVPIHSNSDTIQITKSKFTLRFYNKRYDSENKSFYATRIAAFYDTSNIPEMKTVMTIDSLDCFKPGTGLAATKNGGYESLHFNSNAHHYLYYQNEDSKRVNSIALSGDLHKLEFEIDSLNFMGHFTAMSEIQVGEFYLLLFSDRNNNRIVDEGEYKRLTIRVKENYNGWTVPYWNRQDTLGQTPLHRLFLGKHWQDISNKQTLTLLQEALSLDSTNPNIQDAKGNTALHYALDMHYMGKNKRYVEHPIELIKTLLTNRKCDVNIRNYYYNNNPLQQYLMSGNIGVNSINARGMELIRLFLTRDDLQLNSLNNVNFTAFDYASKINWLENENTAIINKLKSAEVYNYGASQELSKFICRIDFNATIKDLDFYKENIKLCFDYDADPNVIEGQVARSPLGWLCHATGRPYGYSDEEIQSNLLLKAELTKQLMQQVDLDLNQKDYIGETALHYAVDDYATVLVKTLLSNSNTNINSQNSAGNTPLMKMIQNFRYLSSRSKEDAYNCIKILTSDSSRLNFRMLNYNGKSTLDLINDWLFDKERGDINKKLYPKISICLEELKHKIESDFQ